MSDISDLRESMRAKRAHLAAVLATSPTAFGADPLNQVVATLDQNGFLSNLQIAPNTLVDRTHQELADLITDVLRDGVSRLDEAIWNALDVETTARDVEALLEDFAATFGVVWERPDHSQRLNGERARTVVMECSADSVLAIEVDYSGSQVRIQLEPDVLRSWSAELLAERITRLHRLALMRARAEMCAQLEGEWPATVGWPSLSDVERYRRTIDF
jgi:hypothetical protein